MSIANMDREYLRRVGEFLHGERWQTALARDLGVNDRTVRRWLSGESEMSAHVIHSLTMLLGQRQALMDILREEMQ